MTFVERRVRIFGSLESTKSDFSLHGHHSITRRAAHQTDSRRMLLPLCISSRLFFLLSPRLCLVRCSSSLMNMCSTSAAEEFWKVSGRIINQLAVLFWHFSWMLLCRPAPTLTHSSAYSSLLTPQVNFSTHPLANDHHHHHHHRITLFLFFHSVFSGFLSSTPLFKVVSFIPLCWHKLVCRVMTSPIGVSTLLLVTYYILQQ